MLLLMQSGLYAAIVVTDSQGSAFRLQQPARRIVSLAPHITELLFAVGAGDRLVGTVEHSDYPKRALSVPRVGNHQSLDLEAIVALKPDLVLAWSAGSPIPGLEKLQSLEIPVYVSGSAGLEDIATLLRNFARLAGMSWRGEEVAGHFNRLLGELRQQYAHRSRVSVFLQIWDKPLMTINGHHYTNDVIELCGGSNIFADLDNLAPSVGVEAVIKRDPEVILVNGKGSQYRQWLNAWRAWPQLQAVKNGYLYEIKAHTIARPTPRILMGVKRICTILDDVRQSRQRND
jgi:iron complex transport system substrate-binding protein